MIDPMTVPEALRNAPRWMPWRYGRRPGRPGSVGQKQPKVCCRLGIKKTIDDKDPRNWNSFDDVLAALNIHPDIYEGPGFALGDGFAGVDLDNCVNPATREIDPDALAIVTRLDSYAEISPSGTGLKVFVTGRLPKNSRNRAPARWEGGHVELYDKKRFFTITGQRLPDTPATVEDRTDALAELAEELLRAPVEHEAPLSDDELLQRLRKNPRFDQLWRGDVSEYDSQSNADLALCSMLVRPCAYDVERVDRLFRRSRLMREKWDERRGHETYGERTLREAVGRERPVITIVEGEMTRVTLEAIDALAHYPASNVYVSGSRLVRVDRVSDARLDWLEHLDNTARVVMLEKEHLLGPLCDAARWVKVRRREFVTVDPPDKVATQVLVRDNWPGVRYLRDVVEAPTLRPDGSLIVTAGYDEDTGVLYTPPKDLEGLVVPERPTTDDVRRAIETLFDPVCDFPFVSDHDRPAYLAAVLTLVGRPLIDGPTPCFSVRAPAGGTGKNKLVNVVSRIALGRDASTTELTENDELRKHITALALSKVPLCQFENVVGTVRSTILDNAISSTRWEDRLLGTNENVDIPLTTVWFLTGNNFSFSGTLRRRVVPIELDAKMEFPEDRGDFRYLNLLQHVASVRAPLLTAALTIWRAFILANRPRHEQTRMGTFDAWDDTVRSAVIWAGEPDPLNVQGARDRVDAEYDEAFVLFDILHELFEESEFVATDVVAHLDGFHANGSEAERARNLRTRLLAVIRTQRPEQLARSLGIRLAQLVNRRVGGLTLHRLSEIRPARYRLLPIRTPIQDAVATKAAAREYQHIIRQNRENGS